MDITRKTFLTSALSGVVLAAMPRFAVAADGALHFKMGFTDPENSNYVQGGKKIASEVAALTDGRVQIDVYGSSQLGNERDMYEGAQIGAIDVPTVVNTVLSGFIPEMIVLDQPFLFDNVDQAHAAIDGKVGKLIEAKALAQGVHIVGWLESGFRNVFSDRPITKVEDFKNFKIRTMENRMQIAAFNALGATATPMAYGELFTALQQRTVDGCENAVGNMLASRFYEVLKNVTYTNHQYAYIAVGFSDKAWSQIPNDLKPKVQEGVRRGVQFQRQLLLDYNAKSVGELKTLGVAFHDIDREAVKNTVLPALAQFRKSMPKPWLDALAEYTA